MERLYGDDGRARVKGDAQRIAQRRGRGTRTGSMLRGACAQQERAQECNAKIESTHKRAFAGTRSGPGGLARQSVCA